jgi:UDP:flavonoid glycosyltransferase YjiC (YdhE family)
MKILITSVGVPSHLNPLLAAASILSRHHEVAVQTSDDLQAMVEAGGLRLQPELPGSRTLVMNFLSDFPESMTMPHGMKKHAWNGEHFLADKIPVNAANLQHALQQFPADVIVPDSVFFGPLPMLLGPRATLQCASTGNTPSN